MTMADGSNRRLQDHVEYYLFPRLTKRENDEKSIADALEELADRYLAHLSPYLMIYVWQDQPFRLAAVAQTTASLPPHLYGRTHFGDNIEDEWFIVFLLLRLTEEFPDLVVRIVDEDGEFLLIEAADYLEKWMNPETCEKRVYLYQNYVHILPRAQTPAQMTSLPSGVPEVVDAVEAVRAFSTTSKAHPKIQDVIRKRIGNYPTKIREGQHRDHCYVPAALAAILRERPDLVSAAVNAFYLRDPLDTRACRAMKYFPPETRVMTEVVFTKCQFAQLMKQTYVPDKKIGWNLPPPNSPGFKAQDLGVKLACGFEILAANSTPLRRDTEANEKDIDLTMDHRWKRFLENIKEKGYFRGEVEHSKLHNELLEKAKSYYMTTLVSHGTKLKHMTAGEEIRNLLSNLEIDLEQLQKNAETLRPADDDSWLNITPEKLDSLLEDYGSSRMRKPDGGNDNPEDLVKGITSELKSFISHVSSHEGAEFPPKMRNNNPARNANNRQHRTTFDPDAFADAMQSILDFKLPDWEDEGGSSSGMSDYGDESDDMDLSKPSTRWQAPSTERGEGDGLVSEMEEYMDRMDRELAKTTIGQTYERVPVEQRAPQEEQVEVEQKASVVDGADVVDNDVDTYQPIDVDLTALKNILESYNCQQGMPGPTTNLLGTMGIQLPQNVDSCDY